MWVVLRFVYFGRGWCYDLLIFIFVLLLPLPLRFVDISFSVWVVDGITSVVNRFFVISFERKFGTPEQLKYGG